MHYFQILEHSSHQLVTNQIGPDDWPAASQLSRTSKDSSKNRKIKLVNTRWSALYCIPGTWVWNLPELESSRIYLIGSNHASSSSGESLYFPIAIDKEK